MALGFQPPFLEDDKYDDAIAVPEKQAFRTARPIARDDGLFVGASTGMNVAAAVEVAGERELTDAVVTIAVDSNTRLK